MEESSTFQEIFNQDGVQLLNSPSTYMAYQHQCGTIYFTEYKHQSIERYLEWKPNDIITIDSTEYQQPNSLSDDSDAGQEQDWAVVNTIQERTRTSSECQPPPPDDKPTKFFKIHLIPSMSFRVMLKSRQLVIYDGKSEQIASFLFQHGNCEHLVGVLKTLFCTVTTKRDRNWYFIRRNEDTLHSFDENQQRLQRSFAELNILQDQQPSWTRTIRNLRDNPVQLTLETFAKITNYVYDTSGDYAKELLTNSFSECYQSHTEYELIAKIPKLPERQPCTRSAPLNAEQWITFHGPDGVLVDPTQIKTIIFKGGITNEIRKEVWKYLLDHYPWTSTEEERRKLDAKRTIEYKTMKLQWQSRSQIQDEHFSEYRERKHLVDKDVLRTDRTMDFYAGDNNPNLQLLYDILMTYVMYNFDLGYVQGMSDLLSPILHLFRDDVESFWCFCGFMERISNNFDVDQAGMKEQLKNLHVLLAFVEPELANYLDRHDSGNMFFCFRWLLVWFKRELDEDSILHFWEVLWTRLPCRNFHLLVCVAILETQKRILMDNSYGFTEILKHINELCGHLDVNDMLSKAESLFNQIIQAECVTNNIRLILGLPIEGICNNSDNNTPEEEADAGAEGEYCKTDNSENFYEQFFNTMQNIDT